MIVTINSQGQEILIHIVHLTAGTTKKHKLDTLNNLQMAVASHII